MPLLTGCGEAAPGRDPVGAAQAVPANAAVYVGADRGLGKRASADVDAFVRRLTGASDLRALAVAELSRRLGPVSFSRDVMPWLGSRLGGFVVAAANGGSLDIGLVAEARDRHAAAAVLSRLTRTPGGPQTASYRGFPYALSNGLAVGLVGRWMVAGTEGALRATVDARRNGSLASRSRFRRAVAPFRRRGTAVTYLDARAIVPAILSRLRIGAPARLPLIDRLGLRIAAPLGGELDIARRSAELTAGPRDTCLTGRGGDLGAEGPGTTLAAQLPAYGVGQQPCFPTQDARPRGPVVLRSAGSEVIDLDRDLLRWLRPTEVVAGGGSPDELTVQVRGTVLDAVAEAQALPRLAVSLVALPGVTAMFRALRRLPSFVRVLTVRVPGVGGLLRVSADDVEATLTRVPPRPGAAPARTPVGLGDTEAYRKAVRALGRGRRPALFVRPGPLGRSFGLRSSLLSRIAYLASGAPADGANAPGRRVRLILALH